jgi:hypothetical protein
MKRPSTQPTMITLFSRAYAALLILYPATYRKEYGQQMVQVFQDIARDSYQHRGVMGMVYWWCETVLDLIFTAIEQRKEGKPTMSKPLSVQPIKGTGLGLLCILGGVIYFFGGVWLSIEGIPGDPTAIQLTHQLRMMWASGATCGLMGMMLTNATNNGFIARSAAWLAGIGLVIISLDALIAVIVRQPIASFTESSLPFSNLVQIIPLVGWIVLSFLIIAEKRWVGWSRFAPLGMLVAPFTDVLFGSLLSIRFLPVMIMGLALVLLGFAVKTQLDIKRQGINVQSPDAANLSAV